MKVFNSIFDEEIERRGTGAIKWDSPFMTDEINPMWVADMDFKAAPAIQEQLKKAVEHGVYGYKILTDDYYEAVINWMKDVHKYEVRRDWITYIPNVVLGLSIAVQAVSSPGDEIIIFTPVYGPFFTAVEYNDRKLVTSPLINQDGYYTMDFADFEQRITEKTKAVIICNPHNPVGRVWKRDELEKLAEICVRHGVYIISDNIHCEILSRDTSHVFLSSISREAASLTIECTAPSKAFNLAGIHVSNFIISDELLREKFLTALEKALIPAPNILVEPALLGAYNHSKQWLLELNEYLEGNIDFFVDAIKKDVPDIKVRKPEGTYLLWLDCRKTGMNSESLRQYFHDKMLLEVNEGSYFGENGDGFIRINLACSRRRVENALYIIRQVFGNVPAS